MIPHFEPLRNLGPFSEDMFNRIIAFQQREHPAWNATLPFASRIKGLPLHNLVFSNPDRDPARYGATVAPYFPLRDEMQRIAGYVRQVAADPVVCDFHAGNGFIGSLLAREGLRVIGIREPDAKPNQIPEFFDPACYELREQPVAEIDFSFDVAFSSWMPSGYNLTPEILRHRPKLIIYVHTEHANPETGEYQTGTEAAYRDLPGQYQLIHSWKVNRPQNLFHDVWPDLTPSIEETRLVKIFADEHYHSIQIDNIPSGPAYDWEEELEMALLALQARAHLRAQGIAGNSF